MLHPHKKRQPVTQTLKLLCKASAKPDQIELGFLLTGGTNDLEIPTRATEPSFQDNLWQHTCFEVFVGQKDTPNYEEWNFAPSGHWAHYAFSSPRTGMTPLVDSKPICRWERSNKSLCLIVNLPYPKAKKLTIAHTAILAHKNDELTYWAREHPHEEPDFHKPSLRMNMSA